MNPKRIENLLRYEIATQGKSRLITVGAIAAGVVLFTIFGWVFVREPQVSVQSVYFPILMIAGAIVTAGMFREVHEESTRVGSLLRPATSAEKVISKTLISAVGFWLAMSLALVLAYFVLQLLALIVFGQPVVNPVSQEAREMHAGLMAMPAAFEPWVGPLIRVMSDSLYLADRPVARAMMLGLAGLVLYLPLQAAFMFGSVYFKRSSFGRTVLLFAGWSFTYVMVAALLVRFLIEPYFPAFESNQLGQALESLGPEQIVRMVPNPRVLMTLGTVVTTGLFWVLTWLRLRETEG